LIDQGTEQIVDGLVPAIATYSLGNPARFQQTELRTAKRRERFQPRKRISNSLSENQTKIPSKHPIRPRSNFAEITSDITSPSKKNSQTTEKYSGRERDQPKNRQHRSVNSSGCLQLWTKVLGRPYSEGDESATGSTQERDTENQGNAISSSRTTRSGQKGETAASQRRPGKEKERNRLRKPYSQTGPVIWISRRESSDTQRDLQPEPPLALRPLQTTNGSRKSPSGHAEVQFWGRMVRIDGPHHDTVPGRNNMPAHIQKLLRPESRT
jgi:hypothetical protein